MSIDPTNYEISKNFKESKNGLCFLRIKTANGSISFMMSKKQFSKFIRKRERQIIKGKIETLDGKPHEINENVSDYFSIRVENIRRYSEKDEDNIVRLKGKVIGINDGNKNRKNSITIRVDNQKFTCVTESNLYNVKVGDIVEMKAVLQCRDFYLGREVYEDSYSELLIQYIKVQQ